MSPTSERRRGKRFRRQPNEGFTLIEVLVALTLFGLVTAAVAPMIVTGLRATMVAKLDTGAKNLSQERFEQMRNLPYHVDKLSTATSPDLLDTYYRSASDIATDVEDDGYVSTGARRTGEPSTGAFYRSVFKPIPGFSKYRQYVATQFLNSAGQPVTPPATWDTQVQEADSPPSLTVGVTVITEWVAGTMSKRLAVFSAVGDTRPAEALVRSEVRATALRITGTVEETEVSLDAGTVEWTGDTITGPSVAAIARGAIAKYGVLTAEGQTASVKAPPDAAASDGTLGAQVLKDGSGAPLVDFGNTSTSGVEVQASGGEPRVASNVSPIAARLMGNQDMLYRVGPNLTDADLGLNAARPVVFVPNNGGASSVAESSGWLKSVGGPSHAVTSEVGVQTQTVHLLPTSFRPEGLVHVVLTKALAGCSASTTGVSCDTTYEASLTYWRWDPVLGAGNWVTANLTHLNTVDPLSEVDLTVPPVGSPFDPAVGTPVGEVNGRVLYLGEYVQTMSSQTVSSLAGAVSSAGKRVQLSLSGLVTIGTVPLRVDGFGAPEPRSGVTVSLGAIDMVAEDNR